MAWPPPVLPINRTNATPQQDTHAADHNAANQAINDLVARVTSLGLIAPAYKYVQGAAFAPIAASQIWATLAIPAMTATRILTISYHCLVSLAQSTATFEVALRAGGGNLMIHRVATGPREHMIDMSVPTHLAANAATTIDVFVTSVPGGGLPGSAVFANLPYHRLSVAWTVGDIA